MMAQYLVSLPKDPKKSAINAGASKIQKFGMSLGNDRFWTVHLS